MNTNMKQISLYLSRQRHGRTHYKAATILSLQSKLIPVASSTYAILFCYISLIRKRGIICNININDKNDCCLSSSACRGTHKAHWKIIVTHQTCSTAVVCISLLGK